MSDENEVGSADQEYAPPGTNTSVALTLVVALVLMGLVAIYFAQKQIGNTGPCIAEQAMLKSQADAQKTIQEYNIGVDKHVTELRLEVVKQCVAKGNVPIFVSGNVECRAAPKERLSP